MRPCQSLEVLEMLKQDASASLFRKGIELSLNDTQTVMDVYQCWLLLIIDLGYLTPDTLKVFSRKLWTDFVHADVYDLNSACAECLHLVRLQTSNGFKARCSRISTHLYHMIRDDIVLMTKGDVIAAKKLIQLFSWTSRLSLHDIDLTQQILEDYRKVEEEIPETYPKDLVTVLNQILRQWLTPYVPFDIFPQHGPGAIAEMKRSQCCIQDKYELLATDAMLEYAFGDPWWIVGHADSKTQVRESRTVFVPKSYKTFRTISAEPATLQYFQQGVRKALDRQVEHSGYLKRHIGFHDQTRNQLLAREGSADRSYATIDLSSASDSVGYNLVKLLFRRTWLLRYAVCTRSKTTKLPDNSEVALKKFSPMGSSLCFPIETLIFAAVCEKVTRDHRVSGHWTVYGDDIIVPTQCASEAMMLLETLGFHINRDKSFTDPTCWFRESCGGEYCDGFDVTPMKVSRKYAAQEQDVRITKLITLANRAYASGYRNLRYFFIRKLRVEGYTPLFSPTQLLGDNYTNYHTQVRWRRDLQRLECRVSNLQTKASRHEKDSQDESIRYRHWLETTAERKFPWEIAYESIVCRTTVVCTKAWMTKPYQLLDQKLIDESL